MVEFSGFTIQEWLVASAALILLVCMVEIRKLKKIITEEIQRHLMPQLMLSMDKEEMCFYLSNEGYSIVQDIKIEDSKITLNDSGFDVTQLLQFESIAFLKPKEKIKLNFKVFDKDKRFLPEITQRIFAHLIQPAFSLELSYADTEGTRYRFIYSKKEESFFSERIK